METVQGCAVSYAFEFIVQEEVKGNNGFKDESFDALMRKHTTFKNTHAWCVYFVWLCWKLAYIDFNKDFAPAREHFYGGAVRTFRHFKKAGWTNSSPENGCIAIYQSYKNGKATASGHACIVEDFDTTYLYTIEGNSNDEGAREGYEVCQRKRNLSFAKTENGLVLLGFIHIKVENED